MLNLYQVFLPEKIKFLVAAIFLFIQVGCESSTPKLTKQVPSKKQNNQQQKYKNKDEIIALVQQIEKESVIIIQHIDSLKIGMLMSFGEPLKSIGTSKSIIQYKSNSVNNIELTRFKLENVVYRGTTNYITFSSPKGQELIHMVNQYRLNLTRIIEQSVRDSTLKEIHNTFVNRINESLFRDASQWKKRLPQDDDWELSFVTLTSIQVEILKIRKDALLLVKSKMH